MMTISEELKQTVEMMPHIKHVHFTETGEHYLNVHEHDGKKYGRFIYKTVMDESTKSGKAVRVPAPETLITTTMSRDEILGAEAVKKPAKNKN